MRIRLVCVGTTDGLVTIIYPNEPELLPRYEVPFAMKKHIHALIDNNDICSVRSLHCYRNINAFDAYWLSCPLDVNRLSITEIVDLELAFLETLARK